ncbi:hypothetical protein MAR_011511, partial [Mya arenaria]
MFFSDHGSHLERIRNTLVGRVEDRMPLLHLILQDHIKQKFPLVDKVLKQNQERLISHNDSRKLSKPAQGGISLFTEIPKDRSCAQAGIPENFCACDAVRPLNLTQHIDIATKLQTIMIREINEYTSGYPKCLKLENYKLLAWFATLFTPVNDITERYEVALKTVPGCGIFEVTYEVARNDEAVRVEDIVCIN